MTDRQTGKTKPLSEVFPDYYEQRKEGKADDLDNPAWRQFLRQFADFLGRRGLLKDNTYYEICDEQGVDEVVRTHRRLRRICPELPLGNYGPYPLQANRWGETSAGLTDIWGPSLHWLDDPKVAASLRGQRSMVYLCGSSDHMPHLAVHRSYLGPRLAHWQVWRHQVGAFLMFKLNATPHTLINYAKVMDKPLEARFDGPWEIAKGMADWGADIVYPGPSRTMIPSMRLAALRDGMEDYEYFHLLKTRADAFKPESKEERQLLAAARAALEVPPDICGKIGEWTGDEAKVNAHRAKLAELIVQLPPAPPGLAKR